MTNELISSQDVKNNKEQLFERRTGIAHSNTASPKAAAQGCIAAGELFIF